MLSLLLYIINEGIIIILKANVSKHGLKALDLTLEFDEKNVLETNMEYLLQTLEV